MFSTVRVWWQQACPLPKRYSSWASASSSSTTATAHSASLVRIPWCSWSTRTTTRSPVLHSYSSTPTRSRSAPLRKEELWLLLPAIQPRRCKRSSMGRWNPATSTALDILFSSFTTRPRSTQARLFPPYPLQATPWLDESSWPLARRPSLAPTPYELSRQQDSPPVSTPG